MTAWFQVAARLVQQANPILITAQATIKFEPLTRRFEPPTHHAILKTFAIPLLLTIFRLFPRGNIETDTFIPGNIRLSAFPVFPISGHGSIAGAQTMSSGGDISKIMIFLFSPLLFSSFLLLTAYVCRVFLDKGVKAWMFCGYSDGHRGTEEQISVLVDGRIPTFRFCWLLST